MPTFLRRVVAHWPLKLASLALALLLWTLVSAEQVTMHWIPIRVEPELREPRYVVTAGPAPREVRVLFAGPGRVLWQLALDRPTLVLPIRAPEQRGYALEADMVRLPAGVRGVAVREIRPSVVRLEVQQLATREVPVRPRFSRASLGPYVLRGVPEASPARVRVTGPADDLARLDAVETRPVEVFSDDSAEFVTRAALDTSGLREFTISPRSVRVYGRIDVRAERTLSGVRVTDLDGRAAGSADLRLTGPARVLERIDAAQARVEQTPAGQRIVGLPAGVQAVVIARQPVPPDSASPGSP